MLRLITLIILLSAEAALAFEHFKPNREWQTLESKHAIVNYPKDLSEAAHYSITSADKIIPQLSDFLAWVPEQKVQLVLSDQHDFANGYATPIPYNRSVLFVTLPSGVSELQDYGEWLDILILHELTHIIHLDKSHDWAYFPRKVFGRNPFTFPNLFQPNFLKEGLATYVETNWTTGTGRGQSSFYNMLMRTEVDSGLLPLSKVQQFTRDWPLNKSYSYGVYFYQFLDEVYGQSSITRYVETSSGQLIPFMVDRPARYASYKSGLAPLWEEYLRWLEAKYSPQLTQLKSKTNQFTRLSETGYSNASPLVADDGSIYYLAFDPYVPSSITKIDQEGQYKSLVDAPTSSQLIDVSDGQLLYIQPAPCTHNTSSMALYQYDIEHDSRTQIRACAHYTSAAKKGDTLAAIKVNGGAKSLVLLDLITLEERVVLDTVGTANLGSVIWESDSTLLVTIKPSLKTWRVARIDLATNKQQTVLSLGDTNIFEISAGQNAVKPIVTSDASGSIELYELNLNTLAMRPLTRSIGGATKGRYDKTKHTLVYRSYSKDGWDIASAAYNPLAALTQAPPISQRGTGFALTAKPLNAESQAIKPRHATNEPKQVDTLESRPYSALETLAPTSWFFGYTADNAQTTGVVTVNGRDALNFHNWSLLAGRDFDNDLNVFQAAYTAYNHLSFLYSRDYDYSVGTSSGPAQFVDKARQIETDETYTILAHTSFYLGLAPFWATLGVNVDGRDYDDLLTQGTEIEIDVETAGLSIAHHSARIALYGISPAHGRSVTINFERDHVSAYKNTNQTRDSYGNVWTVDWTEYIALYQAHTLVLRAMLGEAEDGADNFDLSDSPDLSIYKQARIHQRKQSLRGYPDSTAELRGYTPKIYSADYRFPIAYIDEGITAWPIGLHSISGAVFYESGQAERDKGAFDAAGVEVNIGLDLGYSALPVAIRAGVAVPFDETAASPNKDTNFYLGLGYSL